MTKENKGTLLRLLRQHKELGISEQIDYEKFYLYSEDTKQALVSSRSTAAFHLTMHCYWCHVESGHLELKEHEAAKRLRKDELESVNWLPADWALVRKLNYTK